jgi:hypothetical protein
MLEVVQKHSFDLIDKLRIARNRSGDLEIQPKRADVAARTHERDRV